MTAARGAVDAQLRQDQALELWVKGRLTYAQIAEELGYKSKSGAHKAVKSALERHNKQTEELAEQGRAIALARLRYLWAKATTVLDSDEGYSSKDILAAAQIAGQMAVYEGVKTPAQKIRLTVEDELDREIRVLLEAVSRQAGVDLRTVLDDATRG